MVTSEYSRRIHKGWDYRRGYIKNTINVIRLYNIVDSFFKDLFNLI